MILVKDQTQTSRYWGRRGDAFGPEKHRGAVGVAHPESVYGVCST